MARRTDKFIEKVSDAQRDEILDMYTRLDPCKDGWVCKDKLASALSYACKQPPTSEAIWPVLRKMGEQAESRRGAGPHRVAQVDFMEWCAEGLIQEARGVRYDELARGEQAELLKQTGQTLWDLLVLFRRKQMIKDFVQGGAARHALAEVGFIGSKPLDTRSSGSAGRRSQRQSCAGRLSIRFSATRKRSHAGARPSGFTGESLTAASLGHQHFTSIFRFSTSGASRMSHSGAPRISNSGRTLLPMSTDEGGKKLPIHRMSAPGAGLSLRAPGKKRVSMGGTLVHVKSDKQRAPSHVGQNATGRRMSKPGGEGTTQQEGIKRRVSMLEPISSTRRDSQSSAAGDDWSSHVSSSDGDALGNREGQLSLRAGLNTEDAIWPTSPFAYTPQDKTGADLGLGRRSLMDVGGTSGRSVRYGPDQLRIMDSSPISTPARSGATTPASQAPLEDEGSEQLPLPDLPLSEPPEVPASHTCGSESEAVDSSASAMGHAGSQQQHGLAAVTSSVGSWSKLTSPLCLQIADPAGLAPPESVDDYDVPTSVTWSIRLSHARHHPCTVTLQLCTPSPPPTLPHTRPSPPAAANTSTPEASGPPAFDVLNPFAAIRHGPTAPSPLSATEEARAPATAVGMGTKPMAPMSELLSQAPPLVAAAIQQGNAPLMRAALALDSMASSACTLDSELLSKLGLDNYLPASGASPGAGDRLRYVMRLSSVQVGKGVSSPVQRGGARGAPSPRPRSPGWGTPSAHHRPPSALATPSRAWSPVYGRGGCSPSPTSERLMLQLPSPLRCHPQSPAGQVGQMAAVYPTPSHTTHHLTAAIDMPTNDNPGQIHRGIADSHHHHPVQHSTHADLQPENRLNHARPMSAGTDAAEARLLPDPRANASLHPSTPPILGPPSRPTSARFAGLSVDVPAGSPGGHSQDATPSIWSPGQGQLGVSSVPAEKQDRMGTPQYYRDGPVVMLDVVGDENVDPLLARLPEWIRREMKGMRVGNRVTSVPPNQDQGQDGGANVREAQDIAARAQPPCKLRHQPQGHHHVQGTGQETLDEPLDPLDMEVAATLGMVSPCDNNHRGGCIRAASCAPGNLSLCSPHAHTPARPRTAWTPEYVFSPKKRTQSPSGHLNPTPSPCARLHQTCSPLIPSLTRSPSRTQGSATARLAAAQRQGVVPVRLNQAAMLRMHARQEGAQEAASAMPAAALCYPDVPLRTPKSTYKPCTSVYLCSQEPLRII